MDFVINNIFINNFKSFATLQNIKIADLSVFLGANSSGKSTALQALLALKQTMECNSKDVELLLSGKYVALGDFEDVIYDKSREEFSLGIGFKRTKNNETTDIKDSYKIEWFFEKAEDKYHAKLNSIKIQYEDINVSFHRISKNKYQMIDDCKETPILLNINNLIMQNNLFLKYDVDYNKLFADFINAMKEIVGGKKTHRIATNDFVSSIYFSDFYIEMLGNNIRRREEKKNIKQDDEYKVIAEKLVDLIEKYSVYQNPFGTEYDGIPNDLKNNLLTSIIKNSGKIDEFQTVFEKYNSLFDDYKNNNEINISTYKGEEPISLSRLINVESKGNNIIEKIQWVINFYDGFESIISKLFFVGPLRENPKGLYGIGFEQNPKYVGPTGSNFASVLLHENKEKEYILPYDAEEKLSLWDALNEWASHLNIASAIEVSHATSFGIKVSVSDTQNKTADIMNVGIGTSQVLPVLITGLLSEEDETLIFEQPELHLHPYSQSRLVDFFVALVKRNRRIIVETHSEAFILRLRYHILKGNCNSDAIAINFFQNRQGTRVSLCNVSGFGNIEFPDDFIDETQELLNDLLDAALKKEQ